jgi:transcriptional regulator with XRE-family HTH domain
MGTPRRYEAVPTPRGTAVGASLRSWREHRRHTQMGLALDLGISARHLSFVENGRALASREMLLRLCEFLVVPHRECNTMLLTAGYAPAFSARPLDDPGLGDVRQAMRLMLTSLEPCPALAIDRHWNMIDSNGPAMAFASGVAPELLTPPVNVLRMSLHPLGLSKQIINLTEWREIVLRRLAHEIDVTNDPALVELHRELTSYTTPEGAKARDVASQSDGGALPVLVPMQLRTPAGDLSFWSATTVFGSAMDTTVSELAIESFLPANEATRQALISLARATVTR